MDVRYRILKNDRVICCNLFPKETDLIGSINSISQKISNSRLRGGLISDSNYCVYAFSSNNDYLKSSQKFKTTLEVIHSSASHIDEVIKHSKKTENKSTSRLIHNLTSLNAHNIQEIYSLVPQENVSKKMGGQISFVENIVRKEHKETAYVLLRIAKNNAAMKAEFSVFRKLFDSNPELHKRKHNVHKVLMNVFYLFFPDFTDKDVKVNVGDDRNTYTAVFDYESFHVALYHLIENAAKYTQPKKSFNVSIKYIPGFCEILMDMSSVQIKEKEKSRIFEEGVSGDLAHRLGKAGDGIGMSRAKKIIELNSGELSVVPYEKTADVVMGVTFQRNVFSIKLPR